MMTRKKIAVILCSLILIILLSLVWMKSRQGYSLLCDGNVDIAYNRGSETDGMHATMSLQLLPDYSGEINISGEVAGKSGSFHIFRSAQFHYDIKNVSRGILNINLDGVKFYMPDAEENILSFWAINKRDIGTSMPLIFHRLDDDKVLIANFYSPILICRKS